MTDSDKHDYSSLEFRDDGVYCDGKKMHDYGPITPPQIDSGKYSASISPFRSWRHRFRKSSHSNNSHSNEPKRNRGYRPGVFHIYGDEEKK